MLQNSFILYSFFGFVFEKKRGKKDGTFKEIFVFFFFKDHIEKKVKTKIELDTKLMI